MKKIKLIKKDANGDIYLRLEDPPEDNFVNVKVIVDKLNEIIEKVNSLANLSAE